MNWIGQTCFFFNKEHFYIAHVFRFPTYFVHFPCFVDAEKRVKKKETSDLTESWIIRYSWFCCPCMRCEMSIIRKMGLWISDVIFSSSSCSTYGQFVRKCPSGHHILLRISLTLAKIVIKRLNNECCNMRILEQLDSLQNLQSFLKDFYTSAKICTVLKNSDLFILIILKKHKQVYACVLQFLQRVGLLFSVHYYVSFL